MKPPRRKRLWAKGKARRQLRWELAHRPGRFYRPDQVRIFFAGVEIKGFVDGRYIVVRAKRPLGWRPSVQQQRMRRKRRRGWA